ncbi:MAG: hypothetical protein ACXVH0_04980 [Thermoanaerobaculia bacterium]
MRLGRTIGFFVLAVVGAALVWLGAGSLRAAQRERAAEAAWAESFGPLGDLPARFPAHPTNDAAHAIEESAQTLGIELRPRGEQGAEDETSRPKKTEWGAVRAALEGWVDAQAAKPEGLPAAPLPLVAAYLAAHAPALDAIEKTLLDGPAPDWATDLGKLHAAPVPNVSGQMQLVRVLVGRAEARAAAKNARADESLRAAFALTGALRGRPEIASQLVSIAATRLELAAVRRIPVEAAAWRERLKTLDPRGAMLATWKREAWVNHEAAKGLRAASLRAGPLSGRLAALVGAWRDRVASAAYLEAWKTMIDAAAKTPVADTDARLLGETFQQALARNGLGPSPAIRNLADSWRRANVLALEIRETDEELAARASKPRGASAARGAPH